MKFFLLLTLLFGTVNVYSIEQQIASDSSEIPVSVIPKIGLNICSVSNIATGVILGYKAGLEFNVEFYKILLGIEIASSLNGFQGEVIMPDGDYEPGWPETMDGTVRFLTLEINPIIGYKFKIQESVLIPRIKPSIAQFLGGATYREYHDSSYENGYHRITLMNYGIDLGIDVMVDEVVLGLGYNLGLTNIYVATETERLIDVKTHSLGVSVGYVIDWDDISG